MRNIWRLGLVSLLGVVSFVVALVNFQEIPARECQVDAAVDPAYAVAFLTPSVVASASQTFLVTRGGEPVTGAQVCMRADMGGMSGMAVSDVARETAPGQYEVPIRFEMGGFWRGAVIVSPAGRSPVRVPLAISVG